MNDSLPVVHLGVGIDTARYAHHVSFLTDDKRTATKPRHYLESAAGYQQLGQTFAALVKKHGRVHFHIRIDAAGQYAENLLQWLHSLPYEKTISVGQPARNKAYRKAHYDKRKADPVESLACARFAIVERPPATPHIPPEFQQLRDAVALAEGASKHHSRLINQLHGILARAFPELAANIKDLSANYVLTLLEKYPTPEKLARAKPESLAKIPHLDQQLAKTLQAVAAESVASHRGILAEEIVHQKVREIRNQQATMKDLEKMVERCWDALPPGPHQRILSIKGIGLQTAAALVAKMVTIDRFQTAKSLIGYFGIFPEEIAVSGTDPAGNPKTGKDERMSRKGNDLVRRLLYMAAQCASKWNRPVKALFARLMCGNLEYNAAIGHCMAKLLRQVFAVWKKDCDFDPDFESRHKPDQVPAAVQTADEKSEPEMVEQPSTEQKMAVGHKEAVMPQRKVVTTTTPNIASVASTDKLAPLDFAQLRQMVPITKVLESIHWQPRSTAAAQWRGSCPLPHDTDSESRDFAVNTKKNVYCCHHCGSEGNVLDLWIALRGQPLLPAAWDLVQTLGLSPPLLQQKKSRPGTTQAT